MTLYMKYDPSRVFTATVTEAGGIDAGQFVKAVSTGATEILVSLCDNAGDDALVVGVALVDGDNGSKISVAQSGIFMFNVGSTATITVGQAVIVEVSGTTAVAIKQAGATDAENLKIGKALTTASAGTAIYVGMSI